MRYAPHLLSVLICLLATPDSLSAQLVNPGDIVTANQSSGNVLVTDPVAGDSDLIANGGLLQNPSHLQLDAMGNIYTAERSGTSTSDPGIVRIDRFTGEQSFYATGPLLQRPASLTFDDNFQNMYVTDVDLNHIVKIDGSTGEQTVVGGIGAAAVNDIIFETDDSLLLLDFGGFNNQDGRLLRMDIGTGDIATVASGGFLFDPADMVLTENNSILVSNRISNFESEIIEIDLTDGSQTRLFELPNEGFIALENGESLIYGNFSNRDILRVELSTGDFDVVNNSVGTGNLIGVAVFNAVPEPCTTILTAFIALATLSSRRRKA